MNSTDVKLNPEIFRAYDIRGIVGMDITAPIAVVIGKATGTFLLGKNDGNRIVVSMDNRLSSPEMKAALIEGLRSTGCDIVDIGMSTSPMMYQAVCEEKAAGGVIVSASHNPKEYNGFKIVGRDAYPVAADDIFALRDIALSGKFMTAKGETSLTVKNIEEEYFKKITSVIRPGRKLKVVIDTGNGIAGKFAPDLYRRLGCEVVEVFTELDGNFPNHIPNPEHEANLVDAMKAVVDSKADFGIGIDGDGDRIGLIDDQGKFLSADYAIILFARDYLKRHPGETILVDVKSSMNVINEIKKNGGTPLLYKTGHSLIKKKMRAENLHMGGEFSGHFYIFENYYPFDDALYASSKVIEILSNSDKPLSEHFVGLPQLYSTSLIELGCADSVKFEVIKKVVELFSKTNEVNDIDGARVEFNSGWAIVRASNTTPFLTFRAESDSQAHLVDVLTAMQDTLATFPEIDLGPLKKTIASLK